MTTFAVSYVSASSFLVDGDQRIYFPSGIRVVVDSNGSLVKASVETSSLSTGDTLVSLYTSVLTSPCTEVWVGLTPEGVPVHTHEDYDTGGPNVVGKAPEHEWDSTLLRFRNPDGTWGTQTELGGGGGGGTSETYTQVGHGFVVQDAVRRSSGEWVKAQADSEENSEFLGIVSEVVGNDFTVVHGGPIEGLSGLIDGTVYYLSAVTAGLITENEPDPTTYWSKPVLVATSTTTGVVLQMRGLTTTGIVQVGVSPDWCPPSFIYKDADEIYLPVGRYYKGGYRFRGQYQNFSGLSEYWDLTSKVAIDIDGAFVADTTSGILGGKVNSSWYNVFLMGPGPYSTAICLLLPFIRVKAIAYGSGVTTINPADHATGGSFEDGFLTANDQWNNYRLVKYDVADPVTDGNVYTIADTVTGTNDQVIITGDVTSEIAALDWLQLVPPVGTDCVYLGVVRIHSDGNLKWFLKDGTNYRLAVVSVNGILNTTPANTDLSSAVPPNAVSFTGDVYVGSEATTAYSVNVVLYNQAGSVIVSEYVNLGAKPDYLRFKKHILWNLDVTATIKNQFILYDGVAKAALLGSFEINGFKE